MNDFINAIINIYNTITGFIQSVSETISSLQLQFSHFKYISLLRLKNFLILVVLLSILILVVFVVRKILFMLVDEHYDDQEKPKKCRIRRQKQETLSQDTNNDTHIYQDEDFFQQFDDRDDDLWYVNSKYRKRSGR